MKTLYIIRHAKSSWDDPLAADFDRPLNDRGKKDAPRMGKRLKEKDIHPDLLISSPAKRAFSTCKKIAEVLRYDEKKIIDDRRLYHAGPDQIHEVIKGIRETADVVMLFGHNPGLTDFVNDICDEANIDNIPTCGVVALNFKTDSWKIVAHENCKLEFFDYPKSRKD
jgi:phosphohistidine phosphatase